MQNFFSVINNYVHSFSKNQIIQKKRCKRWFEDKGDSTLRLSYHLKSDSIVYDIGGYYGEFASDIYNKFGCYVYVFEPIEEFYNIICEKFKYNDKVKVFNFGLGPITCSQTISLLDNSSSLFSEKGDKIEIKIKSISEFINENNHQNIELAKFNIEGAEYDLLENLIETDQINKISSLQIQFHDFVVENAYERMIKIQNSLNISHRLSWQYEFVWENWVRK